MRIVSYNTWLLPAPLVARLPRISEVLGHEQRIRAPLIGQAIPADVDIVVFQEAFDGPSRKALLLNLHHHPHRTKILHAESRPRWRRFLPGGVFIASRHAIHCEAQCVFSTRTGLDGYLIKGAVYAAIDVADVGRVHVVATHLQAHRSPLRAAIRRVQMRELVALMEAQEIPSSEPVFFIGDMNVRHDDVEEFDGMQRLLRAEVPAGTTSVGPSYDPRENSLCKEEEQEFLDYVLTSTKHRALGPGELSLFRPTAVYGASTRARPLSDHYGIDVEFRR